MADRGLRRGRSHARPRLEHAGIARARSRRAARDLLVALAPIGLGEGRDFWKLAAARACGLGLRPRRAALYGAAGRRRVLSLESPLLLGVGVRSRRSRAYPRRPDRQPRPRIGNRALAGRPRVARREAALREYAERFGDVAAGGPLFLARPALDRALRDLPVSDRGRLERVAERIRRFAEAQKRALEAVTVTLPGGAAGHWIAPLERAGCYAPGGRYPLPSSVLMTAVTARAAGVAEIWVASPKPGALTLAAAAVAGADGVLAAGGAHAIAALAFGAGPIRPCDVVVGPGNRYVTAAQQLVAGQGAIDVLAGPSELGVFGDASALPAVIAADLLAQAEHDPDAVPILVTLDPTHPGRVDTELARQLADLPTSEVARAALANGGVVVVATLEDGIAACDALAPEHLELCLEDATAIAPRLARFAP